MLGRCGPGRLVAGVLLLEVRRGWMLLSSISRKQGLEGWGLGAGGEREVQLAWTF